MTAVTAPAGRPTVGGNGTPWGRIRAVARRHAYVLWRSPHRFFDIVFWPVVDVLLWGSLGAFAATTSGTGDAGQAGTQYLLAGLVLFQVLFQSHISVATGFLEETWSRNLLNLMVTPVRELEYAAGVALFGLAKLVMALSLVVLAAVAFFSFDVGAFGLGVIPVAVVLLVCGWAVSLFVVGAVLRFGPSAEILAWAAIFVLMPLSGVFYPVEALPGVIQPLAQLLPTTHAFAAVRELLDGKPLPWDEIGVAALGTAVLGVAGVAFITWMLASFRRGGYVTRFS